MVVQDRGENSFLITTQDTKFRSVLAKMKHDLMSYKLIYTKDGLISSPDKDWFGGSKAKGEVLFPKYLLQRFGGLMQARGFIDDMIVKEKTSFNPKQLNATVRDTRKAKAYQLLYIRDILKKKSGVNHLVNLNMGLGKTFLANQAVRRLNKRTLIVVLAKYMKKWKLDLEESFDLEKGDILLVKGSKGIKELLEMPQDDLPKFIIIGSRTMSNYYNEYENVPDMSLFTYNTSPIDFAKKLKIGTLLIDEIHQEFYVMYKTILYMDVPKIIGLSATFFSEDKFANNMMLRLFPRDKRRDFMEFDRYINVVGVSYRMSLGRKAKQKVSGPRGYSQIALEQAILRDGNLRNQYMRLLLKYVKEAYLNDRENMDKLIIFNSTVEMCEAMVATLIKHYPDMDVIKYTQEDEYSELLRAKVIVSTTLSAGTAVDIPDLYRVFNFINVKSNVQNFQTLGRLRERKGKVLKFYYFYNSLIDKNVKYHYHRQKIFPVIASTMNTETASDTGWL